MRKSRKDTRIVEEIERRYGKVIDLRDSPSVMIEILRTYGHIFATPDSPFEGEGGAPRVSSIKGGMRDVPEPPPPSPKSESIQNSDLLKAILKVRSEIKAVRDMMSGMRRPNLMKPR
jgi:hypothetical protein